ncbi:MAG: bifunctional pyr operon transcriptional regulator/uracil phosphoribosyltransferase PyrR [Herpetosiphon sp.]|nr:bifunctional pyr operon transcriptional regulator/uracil phosphoribosyltransferase PyrR [Herpetosiphon sp.]
MAPKQLMNADEIRRALVRIAHEIVERNGGAKNITLVGVHRRGLPLAHRLAGFIAETEHINVPVGELDIGLYRDDLSTRGPAPLGRTVLPDINGRVVVLVDDVLYAGRTVRAALNELSDWGRPSAIQLAVLVDRGHRELPIRADYVGRNIPTSKHERVNVIMSEIDGRDDSVQIV